MIATCGNSHRQHALIAAAGSATHVPMILGWLLLLASTGHLTSTGLSIRLQQLVRGALRVHGAVQPDRAVRLNLLVPCFPLDCSQIIVSLLCMRGWPKMKVAKFILGSSAVVLVALSLYSFLGIASGDPTASLGLFVALWLGMQTYQLYTLYKLGPLALEQHPLFRGGAGEGLPPAGRA